MSLHSVISIRQCWMTSTKPVGLPQGLVRSCSSRVASPRDMCSAILHHCSLPCFVFNLLMYGGAVCVCVCLCFVWFTHYFSSIVTTHICRSYLQVRPWIYWLPQLYYHRADTIVLSTTWDISCSCSYVGG